MAAEQWYCPEGHEISSRYVDDDFDMGYCFECKKEYDLDDCIDIKPAIYANDPR